MSADSAETGYDTEPLRDDLSLLCWSTFETLADMGVDIPPFPDGYGFYIAYVYEVISDDELDLFSDVGGDIDALLLDLAATKLDAEEVLTPAPHFKKFRFCTERKYERRLNAAKERAYRAGVPLRAELLDLVYQSHDNLGREAESKSLGFKSAQIHPDVYMNELLQGMRVIHAVLPAIMDKLGMDDFELDPLVLRVIKN